MFWLMNGMNIAAPSAGIELAASGKPMNFGDAKFVLCSDILESNPVALCMTSHLRALYQMTGLLEFRPACV